MRRSGAPSQLYGNVAKKPRFVPPGPTQHKQGLGLQKMLQPPQLAQRNALDKVEKALSDNKGEGPILSKALARILNAVPKADTKESHAGIQQVSHMPSENVNAALDRAATDPTPPALRSHGPDESVPDARYFSVMWCKASKKKHKRWEGDAVLVAHGRTVLLKDMEGKDIGRGSGYKCSELETLMEGQTLMVGGKEVEVMAAISPEEFHSGRCFQETRAEVPEQAAPALPTQKPLPRPFTRPGSKGVALGAEGPVCHPRHDPLAPGALVLPRPTENHQWAFNNAGLPVVDVVVDPYLTARLRPHQREGVIFLYECIMGMRASCRHGAILADEMGLGKTLQCIALVWTLLRQGPYGGRPVVRRALIVTPGSLVKNWAAEFNKWLGKERITVFTVDQDHKVEDFAASPRSAVLVISYEMLLRSAERVAQLDFGVLICDEGHRLKNSGIKTSAALSGLSCVRRVILTGTPVQNDLQEFYAIIEFVNPGILGSSSAYRKVYEEPIIRSRQPCASEEERCLGVERAAELGRLTGLFILRRTQEIINHYLPPKLEWTVFCKPAALQLEVYRKLLAHRMVRSCLQGALENSPHLVCIGALKKLCNHPGLLYASIQEKGDVYTEDSSPAETSLYRGLGDLFPHAYTSGDFNTADSGKLLVLVDLLAGVKHLSPSDRVVLVSNYTQTLNLLQDLCTHLGYSCCRLDGQTPVSQRQKLVDRFNGQFSTDFIFLLSSKAGGVGLNLVGASHLILYDIDWNPANDIQAMARVWRDGQRKTVHIYRLLTTGTIEEKIYQRQVSKQGLSGTVVDASKRAEHSSFSVEELRDLFTLHEDSHCVTHNLLGCGCSGDGRVPGRPVEEELTEWRPCQLGQCSGRSGAAKHLSMSELMQWAHHSGESPSFSDAFLDRAREHVTFAFRSTASNPQPQPD
ncbi:DNA repair and recombination protein RAD54B isoform X1 [Brienomyrus brachyistius]|uniref:DNA repair and recombination protein RAD54B isoform X1 n=2 Tax=Brienomyrus brachyistius TaxID=42636 RepID=UPI0020B23129|nr:DNA repair and recombination protein RAD54B isoform X1 [Brienomyrus brachyistius]XP_048881030.1 DNA repair and recombination protein RAD54B isoform X1 [Brienomyrus brachyistius]